MKFSVPVIAAFVGLIAEAQAQVGAWGQCGGVCLFQALKFSFLTSHRSTTADPPAV